MKVLRSSLSWNVDWRYFVVHYLSRSTSPEEQSQLHQGGSLKSRDVRRSTLQYTGCLESKKALFEFAWRQFRVVHCCIRLEQHHLILRLLFVRGLTAIFVVGGLGVLDEQNCLRESHSLLQLLFVWLDQRSMPIKPKSSFLTGIKNSRYFFRRSSAPL